MALISLERIHPPKTAVELLKVKEKKCFKLMKNTKRWWVKECHGGWHLFIQVAEAIGHASIGSHYNKDVLSYLCDKYNVNENDRIKLFDLYDKGFRKGFSQMGMLN